jgi:hypothetical protein
MKKYLKDNCGQTSQTSKGYWEISALAAMLTDFLLIPRTNLQNFKFTFSRKLVSNESMRSN